MRIAAAFLAFFLASSLAYPQVAQIGSIGSNSAKVTTILADTGSSGITIPSNFVGLSVEVQDYVVKGYFQGTSGTWNGNASASSFISLVGLLGANGSFRIGGSSADTVTSPALTQPMANNLQTFLAAIGAGWTPIYGLDLKAADSATAATQAGFLATTFGAANVVFQMGNEPVSSGNFTNGTYATAWNAYYTAITAAVPTAKFSAWDEFNWGSAQTVINSLTPSVSGLQNVTYHWYNINGTVPNTSYLLNSIANFKATFSSNTVWAGSVKQRLSETNSINCGGQDGFSNRMMAATWYLNQAIMLANLGYAGINTHMFFTGETCALPQGYYNAVVRQPDQNFAPGPVFYGLYLFSKISGQQIINSAISGNAFIAAIATLRAAGKANILITNNDQFDSIPVTPQQSAAWSTATVLKVTSPTGNGCNETAPALGGQPIGESGSWSGASFSISNGQSFILGPCEAALVQVQ